MTKLFLLVFLAFGVFANATTLRFDNVGVYYQNNKEYKIDIQALNKSLKKAGLAGLPERIVVSPNAAPYGHLLLKRIEAAEKAMNEDYHFVIENGYLYEYPSICYRGDVADVPKIIDSMTGTFLSDEQGILAMRYQEKTIIRDDRFKSESDLKEAFDGGNHETETWLNYDIDSKDLLLMSDLGAQGDTTELYARVIRPCP